jgi:hypothetical protein
MSLSKHLEAAVDKLKNAEARIGAARNKASSPEDLRAWLVALSDFCLALSDIQTFNNESVHEKLHELRERIGLKKFSSHPTQ